MNEPDFINLKRYDYSLERLLERHPDGVPNKTIAQALMMSEPEVEELWQRLLIKLRGMMKVEIGASIQSSAVTLAQAMLVDTED